MSIKEIKTQRALSPTNINLADYVINPYRGCAFGCLYCYAQSGNGGAEREAAVDVKVNILEVLEKELAIKTPRRVLLGSTTECFQEAETKYRLTRGIMQALNKKNIPYTILTKSHMIGESLDIIAANTGNKIYFTLNFTDESTIKSMERASSSLQQRIDTIKKILALSIDLRIHAGPFMPALCDIDKIIKILPKGIKEIDIELYHQKMGNFKKIVTAIENISGNKARQEIETVYSSKEAYLAFARHTENNMRRYSRQGHIKFFLIVPSFDEFYQRHNDYEQPLL